MSCMFNVSAPIGNVLGIQMNQDMAELLANFIQDCAGDVEPEIWALKNALRAPGRGRQRRDEPAYNVAS